MINNILFLANKIDGEMTKLGHTHLGEEGPQHYVNDILDLYNSKEYDRV
jgi:hypothetical protein